MELVIIILAIFFIGNFLLAWFLGKKKSKQRYYVASEYQPALDEVWFRVIDRTDGTVITTRTNYKAAKHYVQVLNSNSSPLFEGISSITKKDQT